MSKDSLTSRSDKLPCFYFRISWKLPEIMDWWILSPKRLQFKDPLRLKMEKNIDDTFMGIWWRCCYNIHGSKNKKGEKLQENRERKCYISWRVTLKTRNLQNFIIIFKILQSNTSCQIKMKSLVLDIVWLLISVYDICFYEFIEFIREEG